MYIYDNISLNYSQNFRWNCRENQQLALSSL